MPIGAQAANRVTVLQDVTSQDEIVVMVYATSFMAYLIGAIGGIAHIDSHAYFSVLP